MKKLSKKFICPECEALLNHEKVTICIEYTNLLSRGCLQLPGKSLASYISYSFANLDLAQENLFLNAENIRCAARKLLKCGGETIFMCPQHFNNAIIFINNIIINIYFNNKQMIINGRKKINEIVAFKSKRTKRKNFNSIICCCYFHSIYILKFYCDFMNVYITLNKKDF